MILHGPKMLSTAPWIGRGKKIWLTFPFDSSWKRKTMGKNVGSLSDFLFFFFAMGEKYCLQYTVITRWRDHVKQHYTERSWNCRIRHIQRHWVVGEHEYIARLEETIEHYEKWQRLSITVSSVLTLGPIMQFQIVSVSWEIFYWHIKLNMCKMQLLVSLPITVLLLVISLLFMRTV